MCYTRRVDRRSALKLEIIMCVFELQAACIRQARESLHKSISQKEKKSVWVVW